MEPTVRLQALEDLNIDDRLRQVENMYSSFIRDCMARMQNADRACVYLENFKAIEKSLIKRIKVLEQIMGRFCLFSYELGFFTPDNKKEQQRINKLEAELRLKDMRLKEIEDVLGSLKKGNK